VPATAGLSRARTGAAVQEVTSGTPGTGFRGPHRRRPHPCGNEPVWSRHRFTSGRPGTGHPGSRKRAKGVKCHKSGSRLAWTARRVPRRGPCPRDRAGATAHHGIAVLPGGLPVGPDGVRQVQAGPDIGDERAQVVPGLREPVLDAVQTGPADEPLPR
jgi:hypothetical protein